MGAENLEQTSHLGSGDQPVKGGVDGCRVAGIGASQRCGAGEDAKPTEEIALRCQRLDGKAGRTGGVTKCTEVDVGGEVISNNRLEVADFLLGDVEVLVGVDFFLSHRIYVSKSQRRIFFTYNGGRVFALNGAAEDMQAEGTKSEEDDAQPVEGQRV